MPKRAAKPCSWPGCPALVRGRGSYCLEHAQQVQQRTDARRGSSAQRGYGYRWQRLRAMFLSANPLCADPFNIHADHPVLATDVDHILPRSRGGRDNWDNLQALCHSCHSRKTASETQRGRGDQILAGHIP